jgi:hypothetical protein
MKPAFEDMSLQIPAATAEPEDYTGEVYSTAASAGHRKKPIFRLIRLPCSGVTDTRQSVTASGRSAWSVKPPNSRESTGTR